MLGEGNNTQKKEKDHSYHLQLKLVMNHQNSSEKERNFILCHTDRSCTFLLSLPAPGNPVLLSSSPGTNQIISNFNLALLALKASESPNGCLSVQRLMPHLLWHGHQLQHLLQGDICSLDTEELSFGQSVEANLKKKNSLFLQLFSKCIKLINCDILSLLMFCPSFTCLGYGAAFRKN